MLSRHPRIFKSYVDQVNRLVKGQEITGQPCQDRAVQPARKEDGDASLVGSPASKRGDVQNSEP